ncbi:MAG: phosphatidylglycerophosphatase A [Deltaproteobacteria bacterium]|nr:phosphatidylglycerophosphatase A [Deltaproteobacteria bacterium]MBI3755065.1 phosphatidylglycerophosphatase A [Deltaproteobacteria bacterium]
MYIGYSPFAPGTLGTFLGIIICFFIASADLITYGAILTIGSLTAIWLSSIAKDFFNKRDPQQIVCDEIVGYMTAMFLIPFTLFHVIIAFLLFRFFDIVKPFPIGVIDKRIDSALGIVLDDIVAGIYSNIIFRLVAQFIAS